MSVLTVRTADDAELAAIYPEEEEPRSIGAVPDRIQARLEELRQTIDRDTTITLSRNREGCAFGLVDDHGDPRFEVLAFTEDGRVGHGGINQPLYHERIAELCAADKAETA
jgi:hypothetical protein